MPIVMACLNMSKGKVGALIVIEKDFPLDDIVRTGDLIDANINQRLIENIFFKNSPLHDGAMIISHKRIKAAGCILPVSHNLEIPKELDFAIVQPWVYHKKPMPWPLLYPKKLAAFPLPTTDSSI